MEARIMLNQRPFLCAPINSSDGQPAAPTDPSLPVHPGFGGAPTYTRGRCRAICTRACVRIFENVCVGSDSPTARRGCGVCGKTDSTLMYVRSAKKKRRAYSYQGGAKM